MTRIVVASGLALVLGCGASAPSRPEAAQALRRVQAKRDRLREANTQQARKIRELQAQLSLAQAEVRQLRERAPSTRSRTVRIGGEKGEEEGAEGGTGQPAPPADPAARRDAAARSSGPGPSRPLLRLHGDDSSGETDGEPASASDVPPVPTPPAGLPTRLPVAALPGEGERGGTAAPPSGADGSPPTREALQTADPDPPVRLYRRALSHVRARRFEEALQRFRRFVDRYPDHPYADNAAYWRGEVHYALGRCDEARDVFERLVARYPRGNKTPAALLRLGRCHRRTGEPKAAHAAFRRLQREFPDTVAARLASEEDS